MLKLKLSHCDNNSMRNVLVSLFFTLIVFLLSVSAAFAIHCCGGTNPISFATCVSLGCGITTNDSVVGPMPNWTGLTAYCVYPDHTGDPSTCPIVPLNESCVYSNITINESSFIEQCLNTTGFSEIQCIGGYMISVGSDVCSVGETCYNLGPTGVNCSYNACVFGNITIAPFQYMAQCNPDGHSYTNYECYANQLVNAGGSDCRNLGTGYTCQQLTLGTVGCVAPYYNAINTSFNSTEPIPAINQTDFALSGYSWALPFFTPMFIFTAIAATVSGFSGKFGGISIGAAAFLAFTLIAVIFGIYPVWIGILLMLISGFVFIKFTTGIFT
jgi:hypothetical protein